MIIETIPVTSFEQNCRLIIDSNSKEGVVVDPGGNIDKILNAIEKQQAKIIGIWLTHSHLDHCGGAGKLLHALKNIPSKEQLTNVPLLYGHSLERDLRASVSAHASFFGTSDFENCPEPNVYLDEITQLKVGNITFEVIFVPGHTPGHVVFFCKQADTATDILDPRGTRPDKTYAPILLSGDVLFQGTIGRTDLPGGNHSQLISNIKEKLMVLPEDTIVLPGHGKLTTIRREKATNLFLA